MTQRHFITYRLSDGAIVGSISSGALSRPSDATPGFGIIEHEGPADFEFHRVIDGRIVDTSDAKFAADLETKWQRILAWRPQLAHAVPPAPLQPQYGAFRFSCAEIWQDFTARAQRGEWRLRAPAETTEGLAGPLRGRGDCLTPIFSEDLGWFDPLLPAQDDDIVLVKLDSRVLEGIHKRGADKPAWLAMYSEPNPLATKLLKACGSEYWLVTNSTMLPLGRNRILGVLRRTEKGNGERLYESREASNIAPNAATVVSEATDSTASLTNGGGVVLGMSVPPQGMVESEYLLTVIATFDCWITNFGGGTPLFQVVINGNGSTLVTGLPAVPSVTTSPGQRFTVQASTSINITHEAGSGVVAQLVWTGAQPAGTAETRNITLRAECIKR